MRIHKCICTADGDSVWSQVYTVVSILQVPVSTCLHWHTKKHLSGSVFHPLHYMYISSVHACKHVWNNGATVTAREADANARSSARLLRSTQAITLATSNATNSFYPLSPNTSQQPLFSCQQTPELFADREQAQFHCPNTDFDSE